MKTAGPQSHVLASVLTVESPPSPVDPPKLPVEPETPNPFNELTEQDLEEYRKEVQKKQDGPADESHTEPTAVQNGGEGEEEKQQTEELEKGMKALSTNDTSAPPSTTPSTTPAAPTAKPLGNNTPEGSPSKSPNKKKKKFKAPSFLKKSKKQKEKAET